MGQILIRNLDDAVIRALKDSAALNQVSVEEEARRLFTHRYGQSTADMRAEMEAIRALTGPQRGPSSTELLRADRDRDNDR